MARAKLEYDDSGSTFFYFLISFYLLILLPITYYLWPKKKKEKEEEGLVCQCDPCRSKKARLEREKPNEAYKRFAKALLLTLLWSLLVFMVYKVITAETDYQEYDPFEILNIDPSATTSEIKKQYRKLSKVFHPDKQGGDQDMFMKIAKAYEALTDEVSRENWEKYGNPDGPQAATFGIALPAWIVEKQNSIWVLVAYMSVFAVVLPIVVGLWWYKSIKYGSTNVLLQTSQIYLYFMARSKSLTPRRVVMILTAAFEFNPEQSPLVKHRPSDDLELSEIIRSKALPYIDIKTKENPFCAPYAAKARMLVHAHLERMLLRPDTLQIDQHAVLKKSPQLIQEMISALVQYWFYCKQRRTHAPCVEVFECVMSVSQMVVQGMWGKGTSPILQLPHVKADQLKHFKTRKRKINNIEHFVAMKEDERRLLVRALSDEEYLNVMAVCSMFPHVEITVDVHVVDDTDSKLVTAGSVVTVAVNMTRTGLLDYCRVNVDNLLSDSSLLPLGENGSDKFPDAVETLHAFGVDPDPITDGASKPETKTTKSWEKNKKGKKGKVSGSSKKKANNPKKNKKNQKSTSTELSVVNVHDHDGGPGQDDSDDEQDMESKSGLRDSESSDGADVDDGDSVGNEEDEWKRLQKSMKKQKDLQETKRESHPVHSPFYPDDKQECWWLFLVDRRRRELISPPQRITGLKDTLSIDLQFAAPDSPGTVKYTIVLTSDSYLDLSFQHELKVLVHERVEVSGRDQWKELEEEEQEEEVIEESDTTETEGETSSEEED